MNTRDLLSRLDSTDEFYVGPIPSERDRAIDELVRMWLALSTTDPQEVGEAITAKQEGILLVYAERNASRAVREKSHECVLFGLLAQGMGGWRGDWRENVIVLVLLYDACLRIGLSPHDVFAEAARFLSTQAVGGLQSFLARPDDNKSLECMEYEATGDRPAFLYVRMW